MFSTTFVFLLMGFCLLQIAKAQIPIIGSCPSFDCCKENANQTMTDESSGIWYLYGGNLFFFDQNTKCSYANFTFLPDHYMYINVSQYDIIMEQNNNYGIIGNYSLDGNFDAVVSNLKFPLHYELLQLTSDYFIAVACSECGFFSQEGAGLYVYIFTRNRSPLYTVTDEIFAKLEECKIPTDTIIQQSQSSCGNIILGNTGC